MHCQPLNVTMQLVRISGSSVDACLHIFYTWDDNKYHLLEDFGISLQETEYLLFEVTACNDVHLLLMKDREDFVNHVYEIALGKFYYTFVSDYVTIETLCCPLLTKVRPLLLNH